MEKIVETTPIDAFFFGIRLEVPNFFELKSFLLKKSF